MSATTSKNDLSIEVYVAVEVTDATEPFVSIRTKSIACVKNFFTNFWCLFLEPLILIKKKIYRFCQVGLWAPVLLGWAGVHWVTVKLYRATRFKYSNRICSMRLGSGVEESPFLVRRPRSTRWFEGFLYLCSFPLYACSLPQYTCSLPVSRKLLHYICGNPIW